MTKKPTDPLKKDL